MCKYYIAYGSNLNVQQMKQRCPAAKVVGKTILSGWRLRFRGNPYNAVATVEPEEGYYVPVGIWKIGNQDEAALDRYEGYPRLYRKETMSITINGQAVEAMVYIMNEGYPYNAPCFEYIRTIRDGYIAFDLDREVLREAISTAKEANSYDGKD